MQKITPTLWFDRNAEEAVNLYKSLFPGSRITQTTRYGKEACEFLQMPEGTVLTLGFELCGEQFIAMNGGPQFRLNPSVSFMVMCDTKEEVDHLWQGLIDGGSAFMPLDEYGWSPYYGWLNDRFGASWQLYLCDKPHTGQKIVPTLMFTHEQCGRAAEAIAFYTSVFNNANVEGILRYEAGDHDKEGLVKHAQFSVEGYNLMAMDSSAQYGFGFSEALSLRVLCSTQEEIDHYWNALISGGGEESQCGWLKDKFGMSWQVIPDQLYRLMEQDDKVKAGKVSDALLQMNKLVIANLEAAGL